MEPTQEQRLQRQALIRAAIIYAASRSNNTPAHARRLLAQKYNVAVLECEAEAEAAVLAGEMIMELARRAPKAGAQ